MKLSSWWTLASAAAEDTKYGKFVVEATRCHYSTVFTTTSLNDGMIAQYLYSTHSNITVTGHHTMPLLGYHVT